MMRIRRSLIIIFLLSITEILISQEAVKELDQIYGLDQTLYNGKKYTYVPPSGCKGSQYLLSTEFVTGSVTIKEKCYQNVDLNYDIYNQQLLLRYSDETNFRYVIEVSKAWLKDFRLGNKYFEFLNLEQNPRFFQVLGEGPVKILYYWRKNQDVNGSVGSFSLTFTRAVRDSYVLTDGKLKPFSSKKGLLGLFDPGRRAAIKSYIRKNKVKVNKSSDQVMADMITFIGNLR